MTLSRLLLGFICGALAVLFFHQAAIGYLNGLGMVPNPPYRQTPVAPWGVPQIWNASFWGGMWGLLFAWIESRRGGFPLVLLGMVFGAVAPVVIGIWIVLPLIRGTAMFAGGNTAAMIRQVGIHAVWGLGVAVFWAAIPGLFRR